ncbi:MAG: hypothetical protein ACXWVJ_02710 [Caulobacteraceae bacterium]
MKPVAPAVEDAFRRFLEAYPPRRPNPRAPALEVFSRRVREGVQSGRASMAEDLVLASAAYAQEVKALGTCSEFVPHARTWLSQRRFLDYAPFAEAEPKAEPAPAAHPLDFMRVRISEAEFASWIEPLSVAAEGDVTTITARTRTGQDRIRDNGWASAIERQLDAVEWTIARKENS